MGTGTLKVTTPGDRQIVMTRVFDAPRRLVFQALTQPALLRRWFIGPPGWTLSVCEIDARVGGKYRYVWKRDDGTEMGMGGVITEVVVPARMVSTEAFDQSWYPGEAVTSIDLDEKAGKTTLTLTVTYESAAARAEALKYPMTDGVELGYDRLAELVFEMLQAEARH